jgi:acyl-CoA dehydrogenase
MDRVSISHENQMIRDTVRGFVRTNLAPLEKETDEKDDIAPGVMAALRRKAADLGIYGYNMPAELGGPGLSTVAQSLIDEELGRTSVPLAEVVRNLPGSLILCDASQRQWLVPALMCGEKTITYALTEPDAGSDLNALKTRGKRVGGGWMLTGAKQFISNAETSDYIIVLAVTDSGAPLKRRMTTFIVERSNPGIVSMSRFRKMGWRGYHLNAFSLEDCFVPDAHVLGAEGEGFLSMMTSINHDRLMSAGRCVGLAQSCHDVSRRYATERVTFGAKLAEHQAIQFMIADTDTELEAARQLTRLAARLADAGDPDFRIAASRAKLYATEMVGRAADRALQILGGAGFMCDWPIERFYRDARAFRIGEGTSEMQRLQIARHALSGVDS